MSTNIIEIDAGELARVTGGEGTGATSLPGAIGHFLSNNGNGSFASKAGVFGEKIWNRVKYSAAITPTIAKYEGQIGSLPGGADYLADVKRLRPAK